jgi:hypothetical protein
MDARFDVSTAKSLSEAIIVGKADARLKRRKDGSVQLNIANIIPETNKQTASGARDCGALWTSFSIPMAGRPSERISTRSGTTR